jgi:hypothetical protein
MPTPQTSRNPFDVLADELAKYARALEVLALELQELRDEATQRLRDDRQIRLREVAP